MNDLWNRIAAIYYSRSRIHAQQPGAGGSGQGGLRVAVEFGAVLAAGEASWDSDFVGAVKEGGLTWDGMSEDRLPVPSAPGPLGRATRGWQLVSMAIP